MPSRDSFENKLFDKRAIIVGVLGSIVTFICSLSAPIYEQITKKDNESNPIHLEYDEIGPTNPFALVKLETKSLPHEFTKPLDELKIIRTDEIFFYNTGNYAIDIKNTFKPITISVQKPWEIADIKSGLCKGCIKVEWKKLDSQSFQMIPTLLNPKDSFYVDALLSTNETVDESKIEIPHIEIDARIEGLSSIVEKSKKLDDIQKKRSRLAWGIIVFQEGWGTIFCILYVFLFSFLFVILSEKTIIKDMLFINKAAIYAIYAVICVSSAESVSALTIENSNYLGYSIYNNSIILNIPPILLNAVSFGVLIYFYVKHRNQSEDMVANPQKTDLI